MIVSKRKDPISHAGDGEFVLLRMRATEPGMMPLLERFETAMDIMSEGRMIEAPNGGGEEEMQPLVDRRGD